MTEFRLIHAADVHLDTAFRSRSAPLRARLAGAVREAFTALVDLCLDAEAHALVIAGDLFDDDRLGFETERFLLEELRRLGAAGVTTVAVTGNHDPGAGGARARTLRWPDRTVWIRERTPRRVMVRDAAGVVRGHVTGRGHEARDETANLAATFPDPRGPGPDVAVLHTQVAGAAGAAGHAPYAPCTRVDLAARRYDYWALGHVHRTQCVLDDPPAWYPGNLQGRHFGETGPRGALLIEIAGARTSVDFHELAPVRFEDLGDVDVSGAAGVDEVVACVRSALPATSRELVLRARLVGDAPVAEELRDDAGRRELADVLASALGALDLELACALAPPIDIPARRAREDALGLALTVAGELRDDDGLLERLAPAVLACGSDDRAAQLRGMLDDVERELASRMSGETP